MTKKHFIALADVVSQHHHEILAFTPNNPRESAFRAGRLEQWDRTLNSLADFCASQNPNFNRERWLAYIALGDVLYKANPKFDRSLWEAYIAGECGPNDGAR